MATTTQNAAEAKDEAPEAQPHDGPLLDLSDAAVKRMIKEAKKRGYVTVDELNSVLPSEEVTSEQIEDTMSMLSDMGINVVESDEQEEGEREAAEEEPEEEGQADDEDEDAEGASLDELLAQRAASRRTADDNDDDPADIMALASDPVAAADDPPIPPLRVPPVRQGQEFVCRNCHLVKPRVQLADPERGLCRDCA